MSTSTTSTVITSTANTTSTIISNTKNKPCAYKEGGCARWLCAGLFAGVVRGGCARGLCAGVVRT